MRLRSPQIPIALRIGYRETLSKIGTTKTQPLCHKKSTTIIVKSQNTSQNFTKIYIKKEEQQHTSQNITCLLPDPPSAIATVTGSIRGSRRRHHRCRREKRGGGGSRRSLSARGRCHRRWIGCGRKTRGDGGSCRSWICLWPPPADLPWEEG